MTQKFRVQKRSERETNPAALRQAMLKMINRRIISSGELDFPCVPSLLDVYVARLTNMWNAIGRPSSSQETADLRKTVALALEKGYQSSPYARVVVSYVAPPPPSAGFRYTVVVQQPTMAEHYAQWVKSRPQPLFGKLADAKVMALARQIEDPRDAPVLDVGAGTGRNSIPLAQLGHPTDAIELVPDLARQMRAAARAAGVEIGVMEGDVLSSELALRPAHYKLIVLSEVVTHFREPEDVRTAFSKVASAMRPGGFVVFNAFLPVNGYRPETTVREVSQTAWSCLSTRGDLAFLTSDLPFDSVSDECAHDFEKQNLPDDAWPPTGWFVSWSQGMNIFDLPAGQSPIELRWLVYRRR